MTPKEMKVGNIVEMFFKNHGEQDGSWQWSIIKPSDIVAAEAYPELYRPAPLHKDWLSRLGFKEQLAVYSYGDRIVVPNDLDFLGIHNERTGDDIELNFPEFVHQLQDICSAIAGVELCLQY